MMKHSVTKPLIAALLASVFVVRPVLAAMTESGKGTKPPAAESKRHARRHGTNHVRAHHTVKAEPKADASGK